MILGILGLLLVGPAGAQAEPVAPPPEVKLLRFPTTNGQEIVFSYAGQLYTVPMAGGTARRLTAAPGYAIFPRFSPDGRQLAFTAQYDGNTEVYLMPTTGGAPRRLTYTATLGRDDLGDRMGPNNIVMAWKHASPEIVFRSRMRSFNDFQGQLYAVGPAGDLPRQLPVPVGGFLSFSPDDSKMAYNRIFREFRTWKMYRGGLADDIWIFDFKTGQVENITRNPAQDIIPMWGPDNKIYFLSDRDGRLNLFSYDLASKQTVQHTHFRDFDIKFPSLGPGGIVFEEAGCLWYYDLASGRTRRVPVFLGEDLASGRGGLVEDKKFVASVRPSPDGKRAVVVARGDLFTVPAKDGPTRNLTDTSGIHERDGVWSPDGKWIAYLADGTGENEIYLRPQDGRGPAVQVTSGGDTYYFAPVWSPDSQKLLWGDRAQRLRYVDVQTKAVTLVATNPSGEYTEYVWSPDSLWIAYTQPENFGKTGVHLYGVAGKESFLATETWFDANAPAFSDDGKFLLVASSRDFHPLYSDTEWDHAYQNMQRVYLIALARGTESPLRPRSDEVGAEPEEKAKPPAAGAKKTPVVAVDRDGLFDRVIGLPIAPANYSGLRLVEGKVFYLRILDAPVDGAPEGKAPRGMAAFYDFKERKETELGACESFEITADGKRMLVQSDHEAALIDLPAAKFDLKNKLDFGHLESHLDRPAEWAQIYNESWRQMRDYFYAPNMNGVDWAGMRAKYAALLPYVQYRYDLTYLIGELIGELHNSHSYTGGGDVPAAKRIQTGLLGAELSRDPASRAYRIEKILRGENWQEKTRSPLTEVGLNVHPGDYILAVNGHPVRDLPNIYAPLVGSVGRQVALTINSGPLEAGAREITVVPIADEAPLYYYDWVQRNLAHVAARTDGQVGYLHIPDMEPAGLSEFVAHFFPQLGKKALIIDDRGNGGGNVSPMIIERLRRKMAMIEITRNGQPTPNPSDLLNGPLVLLINGYSASDGDIFPYRFRAYHLGTIIGERTWGGVIGIRDPLPLSDGGFVMKPEFAPYAIDGKNWIIENHGVEPDIAIDNDPAKEFAGVDQQLDRAIDEALAQLKTKGALLPPPPPYPDKH